MDLVKIQLHSGKEINYYVCPIIYSLLTNNLRELQSLLNHGHCVNVYQMAIYNAKGLSWLVYIVK